MAVRLTLAACLLLAGCAARGPWIETTASWYGPGFAGRPTASGEVFRPSRLTAAHRELPFGTVLLVERADGAARVRVVVNDRGPYVEGRGLDLARKAARVLDMLEAGLLAVRYRVIGCKDRFEGPRSCESVRP